MCVPYHELQATQKKLIFKRITWCNSQNYTPIKHIQNKSYKYNLNNQNHEFYSLLSEFRILFSSIDWRALYLLEMSNFQHGPDFESLKTAAFAWNNLYLRINEFPRKNNNHKRSILIVTSIKFLFDLFVFCFSWCCVLHNIICL